MMKWLRKRQVEKLLRESGAVSGRSMFIGASGMALLALALGSSAVLTSSSSTTTSPTTAPSTTTTTIGGGDPCTSENPTTTGFPCLASIGVHGVTFTAANTTAHDSTHCTVCPTGMTWSTSQGYRINSCTTIDRWKFSDDTDVFATNGVKQIFDNEATAIAQSCVKITNSLLQPPDPGSRDDVALSTGFSGGCCGHTCTFASVVTACGPVYLADSEVSMSHPANPGTCGGGFPCNSGFSYAVSDTNQHLWRDYLHGTSQGIDTDGYSEVHDSVMRADRSDQITLDAGHPLDTGHFCAIGPSGFGIEVPSGTAGSHEKCSGHGDAYFQDSGSAPWMLIDHSSLYCGTQMIDCNVSGAFIGDQSAPDGGVVKNNLFKKSTGVNFCMAAGASESGKPFPTGFNLTFKNNVYEIGPSACTHANAVKTWAAGNNNHACNNKMDDGTPVSASFETGGCP